MIRFAPALLFAVVAFACGGQVQVGTLAGDGSAPSTRGPAGSAHCPSGSGQEELYTLSDQERVSDFFGDGASVYVGIYSIAPPQPNPNLPPDDPRNFGEATNGRFVTLPGPPEGVRFGGPVGDLAHAKNGPFVALFGDTYGHPQGVMKATDSGVFSGVLDSSPTLLAAHPERDGVFYTNGQSSQPTIFAWDPPAKPTVALTPSAGWEVVSLSVSATAMVALARRSSSTNTSMSTQIIRPPAMAGGGQYEVVATLNAPVSNVVLDGEASLVVERVGNELVVERFEGKDLRSSDGVKVGSVLSTIPRPETDDTQLEVDESYVYVAHALNPDCTNDRCATEIVRFKKDGSGANDTPTVVKAFQGDLNPFSWKRAFNVDGCYLIWFDTAQGKLFRQAK
jgi:hypothetical protein